MSHKQKCIGYCLEQLTGRNLHAAFNQSIFNSYYTKFKGSQGNAFLIGINTADAMIENYKPTTEELTLIYQQFNS